MDETNLQWRKSSRSGAAGHCVEVAESNGTYYVRDSKNPNGPKLRFTTAEWTAFIGGTKDGEFDVQP